ncbi:MAG: TlpA disulfide reductase family protein [Pseudomonadota bacterium]
MGDEQDLEKHEPGAGQDRRAAAPPASGMGTSLVIAAIAGLAGFAAVYMTIGGDRNGAEQPISPPSARSAQAPAPDGTEADRSARATGAPADVDPVVGPVLAALKPLTRGEMGTFVVRKEKGAPPDGMVFFDRNSGNGDKPMDLAPWRGKVVLFNIWATWCKPCTAEMPYFAELKAKLGGPDFDVVAVSIDRGGPEKPRAFLERIGAQSLGLYQGTMRDVSGPVNAFGMPTTVLYDREGRELGRLVGEADWSSEEAYALIRKAIEASS